MKFLFLRTFISSNQVWLYAFEIMEFFPLYFILFLLYFCTTEPFFFAITYSIYFWQGYIFNFFSHQDRSSKFDFTTWFFSWSDGLYQLNLIQKKLSLVNPAGVSSLNNVLLFIFPVGKSIISSYPIFFSSFVCVILLTLLVVKTWVITGLELASKHFPSFHIGSHQPPILIHQ